MAPPKIWLQIKEFSLLGMPVHCQPRQKQNLEIQYRPESGSAQIMNGHKRESSCLSNKISPHALQQDAPFQRPIFT
jgi:hypothetical protein